ERDQDEDDEGEHRGEDRDRSPLAVAVSAAPQAQHAVPRHISGSSGATAMPVIVRVAGSRSTPKMLVSMSHRTVTVTVSPSWAGWPSPGKPATETPAAPVHRPV